jgi:NTP pyrophosphatase (non-canonical NTP hydrolase)
VTFDEYQAAAMQTASPDLDIYYALAKLVIEAGEALQLHCKEEYHGKIYTRETMIDELGDVLWYLQFAAHELGTTMDAIAAANVAKLRARHGEAYNAAHYQEPA